MSKTICVIANAVARPVKNMLELQKSTRIALPSSHVIYEINRLSQKEIRKKPNVSCEVMLLAAEHNNKNHTFTQAEVSYSEALHTV